MWLLDAGPTEILLNKLVIRVDRSRVTQSCNDWHLQNQHNGDGRWRNLGLIILHAVSYSIWEGMAGRLQLKWRDGIQQRLAPTSADNPELKRALSSAHTFKPQSHWPSPSHPATELGLKPVFKFNCHNKSGQPRALMGCICMGGPHVMQGMH